MNRLEYYYQFKSFQQSREKYFSPSVNKAFNNQYKQFLAAFKKTPGIYDASPDQLVKAAQNAVIKIDSQGIIDTLQPLYMDSIKYGAKVRAYLNRQKAMAPIGFNDRMIKLMQAYFGTDILNVSEGITDTTKELIQQVFSSSVQLGLGVDDIIKLLENTELSRQRARLITRTETVTAANQAGRFAAEDTGLQMNKEWLATMDNRTRKHHLSVDGQVVGFDDYFKVSGVTMLQPGDRKQENGLPVPASEVVNCRCCTLYLPLRDGNGKLLTN